MAPRIRSSISYTCRYDTLSGICGVPGTYVTRKECALSCTSYGADRRGGTVQDGVYISHYHIPLGRLSKVDCLTTKRAPTPNGASSESSRQGAPKADRFGTDTTIPAAVEVYIDHGKSAQERVRDIYRRVRYSCRA